MIATTHRIRRLRWRVKAGSQAEAFDFRLRLRRMHEAGLLTELERIFDAANVGDEVVHIPRLELTLRVADLDQIGPALAAGLYREIASRRTVPAPAGDAPVRGDQRSRATPASVSGVDALMWYLETGMLPWPLANAGRERALALLIDASTSDPARVLAHVPPPLRAGAIFLFRWLQLVPEAQWIDIARRAERAAPAGALSGLEDAIRSLSETSVSILARAGRERLTAALRALERRGDPGDVEAITFMSEIVSTLDRERVAAEPVPGLADAGRPSGEGADRAVAPQREQRPTFQWTDIADRIERAAPEGQLSGLVDVIRSLSDTRAPAIGTYARHRLASTLLAVAIKSRGDPESLDAHDAEVLVSTIISTLAPGVSPTDRARAIDRLPVEAATWVRTHILPRTSLAADRVDMMPVARPAAPPVPATSVFAAPALHRPPDSTATPHGQEAFGLAVDDAGLVLLHPFLPRLFEQTGLLRAGDELLAESVRPRAAALLSFASRGVDEPIEFELGFIKVLLGLRPEDDLQVSAGLIEPADSEEVDALLHSAIEHWKVLRHTSIDGLRGSFLQRPGLLAEVDGFWRLRVEPKPFDILLDQLPWAISTVKLPWMTIPLFTEWMTP